MTKSSQVLYFLITNVKSLSQKTVGVAKCGSPSLLMQETSKLEGTFIRVFLGQTVVPEARSQQTRETRFLQLSSEASNKRANLGWGHRADFSVGSQCWPTLASTGGQGGQPGRGRRLCTLSGVELRGRQWGPTERERL